jgi:hypothetical protein
MPSFLYLAFILDVYSERIVGWATESHLRIELVVVEAGEYLLPRVDQTPDITLGSSAEKPSSGQTLQ